MCSISLASPLQFGPSSSVARFPSFVLDRVPGLGRFTQRLSFIALVVEKIANGFLEVLVAEMRSPRMGDPLDRGTQVGPQARHDLRASLHRRIMLRRDRELPEIAETLHSSSRILRRAERREQQTDQQRDDADDDEKLDECERATQH